MSGTVLDPEYTKVSENELSKKMGALMGPEGFPLNCTYCKLDLLLTPNWANIMAPSFEKI